MKSTFLFISATVCCNVNAFSFHASLGRRATSTKLFMSAGGEKRRVVVTGLGVINGCGVNHDDFFQNVVDGKSSLRQVSLPLLYLQVSPSHIILVLYVGYKK